MYNNNKKKKKQINKTLIQHERQTETNDYTEWYICILITNKDRNNCRHNFVEKKKKKLIFFSV